MLTCLWQILTLLNTHAILCRVVFSQDVTFLTQVGEVASQAKTPDACLSIRGSIREVYLLTQSFMKPVGL